MRGFKLVTKSLFSVGAMILQPDKIEPLIEILLEVFWCIFLKEELACYEITSNSELFSNSKVLGTLIMA